MKLNNELVLSFPEEFHVMGAEEKESMQFITDGPGECFADPSRKIMISIGWKKISKFAGFMLSAGDVAEKMEKSFAESMSSFGYETTGRPERKLGGDPANGVSFKYNANDTDMIGESFVVKHNSTLYYLHYYTREALAQENSGIWNEILDSAEWS